ncbi:MAG: cation:proton antiporter [Myxococcales bacterium]|nr:cation:proton antiporter [Myxococcales bacterium]
MHGDHDLLKALTVVLGTAGAAALLSKRLHQPVVLGYIVAGLVVGPNVGVPLVADPEVVSTLSELGVVLLMFSLGLEFSLRKLIRVGAGVAITAIIQCSLLFWLGFTVGRAFGWTTLESLFTGAILAISSTTIIAKAFDEQGIKGRMRELVVGVLIVEDLIAILLMATLTAVANGAGLSAGALASTAARLAGFLVALVVLGLLVIPRATRRITAMKRPEVTLVASVAVCFGIALLARELGYSVALGAFLAGSLIAESGEELVIEHLVRPVRDLFGAVFFVSVGMMMDPSLMAQHWVPILVLTVIVVVGKIVGVGLGAFLTGNGARTSIQAGMSLAQIGEFSSFIIAALGLSLGATREFIYPVAVAVSAITTLLTPWLIRASVPVASWVDRTLPGPLQTLVSLYGSWLEHLRPSTEGPASTLAIRSLLKRLIHDAVVLAVIVVAGALGARHARAFLVARDLMPPEIAGAITIALVALIAAPFCIGIVRVGRKLGTTLADLALPPPLESSQLDLAAAARRALVVTLQLAMILLVGAPFVAITQPFLPGLHGAELFFGILVIVALASWRSARNLEGHVRAGAQVIAELLSRQSREPAMTAPVPGGLTVALQGLGEPIAIGVSEGSPAAERTLSELNLRGLTGATVLAITRGDSALLVPTADERLHAGDVLAVAGTREAVASARALVTGTEPADGPSGEDEPRDSTD